MTHCFDISGEKGVLSLSGTISIEHAAELKTAITEALGAANRLVVNLSGLAALDLCCLQLLCSAHKSAVRSGRVLEIEAGGETMADALEETGFLRHVACNDCQGHPCLWAPDPAGKTGGATWE